MSFTPPDAIVVKRVRHKGQGVFATRAIARGEIIERAPVLILPLESFRADPQAKLSRYVFHWGRGKVGLVLGYGSLYNHSYQPNAYYLDRSPATKLFRALRDIVAGEEITINYNGEPNNEREVDFEVH